MKTLSQQLFGDSKFLPLVGADVRKMHPYGFIILDFQNAQREELRVRFGFNDENGKIMYSYVQAGG